MLHPDQLHVRVTQGLDEPSVVTRREHRLLQTPHGHRTSRHRLDDGVRQRGDELRVVDVSTLLAEAVD